MTKLQNLKKVFVNFHRDERGESSTLSNVMMLAVAAIAVVALIAFGKTALDWLRQMWPKISGANM
ncbi:MAG: hypothetical protein RLY14_869 [Planctomycetota bacterium]|jgi:Flp pilus assembly pilin Flp